MTLRALLLLSLAAAPTLAQSPRTGVPLPASAVCDGSDRSVPHRNLTREELRCRYGVHGRGRFGLSAYADVPVYQPDTPLPGSHVVGVPGLPGPRRAESHEEWEWRVLTTEYGPEARRVHRGLEVLDPVFAERIVRLEAALRSEGVRFARRETWRAPERQAYLFQQGRARPGALATTTLTSWHSRVDARGNPAGRAVDYDVPARWMRRFHEVARQVGLESFGADSNDPGHVFLPGEESVPALEVALLRLLPRVPVVTLATGRPDDERPTRATLVAYRAWAREWLAHPRPRLEAALSRRAAPRLLTRPAAPVATAEAPEPARPSR